MEGKSAVSCQDLGKEFGSRVIFENISLTLESGTVLYLVGANGTGKTTLLRVLAGLEEKTAGEIAKSVGSRILYLPQDFVVWPHMSVWSNLKVSDRFSRKTRKERIADALEKFGLEGLEKKRAGLLSFGQQHRLALARALFYKPDVLLLDEPLAHADPDSRESLIDLFFDFAEEQNAVVLWVTHSQNEIRKESVVYELKDRVLEDVSDRFR